jgi:hypothetical protein
MLTGRNFSGFQQRCDEGCCRVSETASVAGSGALPAGMLKGADGFGLKAHGAPTCLDNSAYVVLSKSIGSCRDMEAPGGLVQEWLSAQAGHRKGPWIATWCMSAADQLDLIQRKQQ